MAALGESRVGTGYLPFFVENGDLAMVETMGELTTGPPAAGALTGPLPRVTESCLAIADAPESNEGGGESKRTARPLGLKPLTGELRGR